MSFQRLLRGDAIAAAAALVLMLVMSLDWYTTEQGEEARRIQDQAPDGGPVVKDIGRQVEEGAELVAETAERTAWQAFAVLDLLLLAAIVLALVAAAMRAMSRRYEPPYTPSGLAALAGSLGMLLLAYRIVDPPGSNAGAVVKPGALLGLLAVGVLTLGAASALRREQAGTAWSEPATPARPPEGVAGAEPPPGVTAPPAPGG